jgi:hypothetical protein
MTDGVFLKNVGPADRRDTGFMKSICYRTLYATSRHTPPRTPSVHHG